MLSHHPLDFCHRSARWMMMERRGLSDCKDHFAQSTPGGTERIKEQKGNVQIAAVLGLYQSGAAFCGGGAG